MKLIDRYDTWVIKRKIRGRFDFLKYQRDIYSEEFIDRQVDKVYQLALKENWSKDYLDRVVIDVGMFASDELIIYRPHIFT